jgi:hypothetical protein
MQDELQKKLLADLEKTGFASEMRAIQIFSKAEWITSGATSYYDFDSNLAREIDIKAHIWRGRDLPDGRKISCYYQIVGEVKKSASPWIVFKQHVNWDWELIDAWTNLINYSNLPVDRQLITDSISFGSLCQVLKWKGYGIHESFKDPKSASKWYSAFVSSCKAGESTLAANKQEKSKEIYLFFVKPLVIIDGDLISAELTDTGSILLSDIDSAPFTFWFKSSGYDREVYSVDVVRLSGLASYLKLSKVRFDSIFKAIENNALNTQDKA